MMQAHMQTPHSFNICICVAICVKMMKSSMESNKVSLAGFKQHLLVITDLIFCNIYSYFSSVCEAADAVLDAAL